MKFKHGDGMYSRVVMSKIKIMSRGGDMVLRAVYV